jgi:hypothetical protein
VSAVGSKIFYKKEKDFEDANIRVPMAIAKAAKIASMSSDSSTSLAPALTQTLSQGV